MNIFKCALFISFGLFLAGNAVAGDAWVDSAWKCYIDGGGNRAVDITKAETLPLDTFSNNPPHPRFVAHPGDALTQFNGLGLSPGMTITGEVVTTWQGHKIYCFTCRHKLEDSEPAWTFDWAVLAADVSTDKSPKKVRVFFVLDGNYVRDFKAAPVSIKEHPYRIEIDERIDGNGAGYATWVFELTKACPWLVENTGGERHEPVMTFHYNKAGKVIKVEKDDPE